jgi:hypothetical protein
VIGMWSREGHFITINAAALVRRCIAFKKG